MKVAISAFSENMEENVCPIFGRAPGFLIVIIEDNAVKERKFLQNSASQAFRGAGIQAAQLLLNEGVDALITMQLGPNAFTVLQQAGIKIFRAEPGSVRQNIEKLISNKLQILSAAAGFGRGLGFGRGRGFGPGGGRGFGGRRWQEK